MTRPRPAPFALGRAEGPSRRAPFDSHASRAAPDERRERHPTGAIAGRVQRGQALVEYALIVGALATALFVPFFPGPDGGGRRSIFMLFIEAFDIYIDSFHTMISLPFP